MVSDTMKSLKILIVEDDIVDRKLLERHLSRSSLELEGIACAGLLSEAVTCLEQDSFDIVFSDLGLPDSEGLSAIDQIRSVAPSVPLVILSGFDDETAALNAVEHGAQDYLIKDNVDSLSLVTAIQHAMDSVKAQMP